MLITLSIGIALKSIKHGSDELRGEHFILQSSIILDDILNILKDSKELNKITDVDSLSAFLDQTSILHLDTKDVKVTIEMESARSKINPNSLITKGREDAFKFYVTNHMINEEYAYMIFDLIGGIKEDSGYNTDIFIENPHLFREHIVSKYQLDEVKKFYEKKFHENSLNNINTEELFYITKDTNSSIYSLDVNYLTVASWELILECTEDRAEMLHSAGGSYETISDLQLSLDEKLSLSKFASSTFEPYIDVKVKILQAHSSAYIRFEYNIKTKKGSNFVFEI